MTAATPARAPASSIMESLWPRWLFLRALGLIFLSAFYSLAFQAYGLIGERGILPASAYLDQVRSAFGPLTRVWYAPTLLWLGSGDTALRVIVGAGLICSVLLVLNVWPRITVAICTLLFLSCIATLQIFSSYQSDGMLLEAGFISIFFAPRGILPGLGASDPPSVFSRFMLVWEWFRIYFESGVAKLASGDPHWRNLTAMDDYYQNGPLPSWIGWYVQHFPHWYHAGTVLLTLFVEIVLVWAVILPRRIRLAAFAVVTALQIGIIATANYAFLNYLVLALGLLILDDQIVARIGLRPVHSVFTEHSGWFRIGRKLEAVVLGFTLYATIAAFLFVDPASILAFPVTLLSPFRFANAYGLFGVMTEGRYEIEFQGSRDGVKWTPYPFRYKPQDPRERPGFFAPYQPRFDWNLWFASLDSPAQSPWLILTQQRLLEGSPPVLALFRSDPFRGKPPEMVRTVLFQYWFTDTGTMRRAGLWWRRKEIGQFTTSLAR